MKTIYFKYCLLFLFSFSASAEVIKQNTVDNYLLKAKQQAESEGRQPNHLIDEASPYLLQHAYNPVNWYAWGDEAFEKARKENKPIFLSIGYSTCHWCHVMARESFENKKIAAVLNKYFISIKVDREQRPDIDNIYMSATQLINGHGGWPMTVFIDHQLRPFHAGTYYPPFSTDKHLGLEEVLLKIHELWRDEPENIKQIARQVTAKISATSDDSFGKTELQEDIYQLALKQIKQTYDAESGGFGAAPKFPRPGIFALLNKMAKQTLHDANKNSVDTIKNSRNNARQMISYTLDMMAAGGIYDQIGGGFHRYSVDENWQVPHFEKMLYNQALMVMAYTELYQLEPRPVYKKIVYETLNFVRREMRSEQGGYYSALDADSDRPGQPGQHAEGAYYLWYEAELKKSLSDDEFLFIKKYFHIRKNGNIFSDPQNEFTDLNILYIDEEFRGDELTSQQLAWLQSVSNKLNIIRHKRPRPHLDDKVITSWNGMMLASYANAAGVFDEPSFLEEAKKSADFIKAALYDNKHKKLYRQYRDFSAGTEATLSDYAWLIYGLLEVYVMDKDEQWLNWALELQAKQDELFLDTASGAYFESVAADSSLLFRSKTIYDGALPAENAIALSNLRRFSSIVNRAELKKMYKAQADDLVSSFAWVINQNPASASMLLSIEIK